MSENERDDDYPEPTRPLPGANAKHVRGRLRARKFDPDALRVPGDAGEWALGLERVLRRIPDAHGRWISTDRGWYPVIVDLDEALARIDPDYTVHQVKEKFGGLRYYWQPSADLDPADVERGRRLIRDAERRSYWIDEQTGEPGATMSHSGWLKTRDPLSAASGGEFVRRSFPLFDGLSEGTLRELITTADAEIVHWCAVAQLLFDELQRERGAVYEHEPTRDVDDDPHLEAHFSTDATPLAIEGWTVVRQDSISGRHTRLVLADARAKEELLSCWEGASDHPWGVPFEDVTRIVRHVAWHVATGTEPDPNCAYEALPDSLDDHGGA